MKQFTTAITAILAIFLTTFSCYALNKSSKGTMIQNTSKAVQFFEKELDFKTNPHGVNRVVTGDVKNVVIVDVRSEKDFNQGHIPGAINIPFEKFSNFEGNETEFPGLTKEGYNYVYCYELLCNLAQKAAMKFASHGYPVKEVAGGYKSWKDDGYPIEK